MIILARIVSIGLLIPALWAAFPNRLPLPGGSWEEAVAGAASETPSVGDQAPDFELVDQNGEKVQLSSFRGEKNVVLAFYVLAFTGG